MALRPRTAVAALALSAAGLIGIVTSEGWEPVARPPVPGDVATNGFGSTTDDAGLPLKGGEVAHPVTALQRAARDITRFEGAIKTCVRVPLYQHEYDAYTSLTYNIGESAFCGSTLVRKLNAGDYQGACAEILRWNKFQGRELRGLTARRQREYRQCMGEG